MQRAVHAPQAHLDLADAGQQLCSRLLPDGLHHGHDQLVELVVLRALHRAQEHRAVAADAHDEVVDGAGEDLAQGRGDVLGVPFALEEHGAALAVHLQAVLQGEGLQLRAVQAVQQHAAQDLVAVHVPVDGPGERGEQRAGELQDLLPARKVERKAHDQALEVWQPQKAHGAKDRHVLLPREGRDLLLADLARGGGIDLFPPGGVDGDRQVDPGQRPVDLLVEALVDSHVSLHSSSLFCGAGKKEVAMTGSAMATKALR